MKLIGYWIESLRDRNYYPPQDYVREWDAKEKEQVIDYLSNGDLFLQFRGLSWCRFNCGVSSSAMGSREFTDGYWVWPEGLVHYVEHHNVLLPREFINHALLNRKKSVVDPVSTDVDDGFWKKWCLKNSSASMQARLQEALIKADALYDKQRAKHFDAIEKSKGLSDASCITKKCNRQALKGMVFCAECANKLEAIETGVEGYFTTLVEVINA